MKKIFTLMIILFVLVSCGEKFPYTSKSDKEKMIRELQEAVEKSEKSGSIEDVEIIMQKWGEINKITIELRNRISAGDKKAEEELEKWNEVLKELKAQS